MTEPLRRRAPLPRIPFILLFLAFIVVAFALAIERGTPSPPIDPDAPRATPGPGVPLPMSIEDGLPQARARALQWRDDARLILVSAQLDWIDGTPTATGLPRGGALTYTFAGSEEDRLGRERFPLLTVMIGRESGRIFYESEETVAVQPGETVQLIGLPIDSTAAFRLAQRLAGESYRAPCADLRKQVQVILDTTGQGNPSWVVVYYDQRDASHNDIVVRIDAVTGAPTVDADTPIPCPPS